MRYISSISIRWASALALLVAISAQAETVHISHCYRYCPESDQGASRQIVIHHLYAAAVEQHSGLAEWVAYRVLGDSLGVASLLPRLWQPDPLLNTVDGIDLASEDGTDFTQPDLSNAQDREYRVNELELNSEDRGRLAPMTSFAGTPYWDDLNNLSNMSPLPTDLRVGPWARLEQAINALASQAGEAYVVSGPLVAVEDPITDPAAYYKVVVAANRLSAFVFPADLRQNDRYCTQISTLDRIQAVTHLDLLPGLSRGELNLAGTLDTELGCGESE